MLAIVISCLCCLFQTAAGLLLPGMFVIWAMSRPDPSATTFRETRAQFLFQCVAAGSIVVSCLFLVQYFLFRLGLSVAWVASITIALQIVLSGFWCRAYRRALMIRLAWWSPRRWQSSARLQGLTAVAFGLAAILFFPHSLDNSAIGWITHSLDGRQALQDSQGAMAYIGMLFLPAWLLQGIAPVPTVAVGMKILLSLLLAAACRRLVEVVFARTPVQDRYHGWCALMMQWMVWTTFFGKYGVFETGKETAFAILFLLVFAAELIEAEVADRRWYWLAALPLAAASGFGAMAVPYGLILTTMFLVFSVGRIRLFRFGFCCLTLGWLPLVVSFHAMADWSWSRAIAVISVPVLVAYGADRLLDPDFDRDFQPARMMPNWVPWLVLAASVMVVAILLPFEFYRGYFPLDGKAGLLQLISHQNKFVLPGILGMALVAYVPSLRGNTGIMTLLAFPFVALVPALIMARWYTELRIPIHPQNVWDWAKDIPNWVAGIYFALLAATAVGCGCQSVARWLAVSRLGPFHHWNRWAMGGVMLFLLVVNVKQYAKIADKRGIPTYTAVGGHHDPLLAEFVAYTWRLKTSRLRDRSIRKPVLLADESRLQGHQHVLWLFGVTTISERDWAARGPSRRSSCWCVTPTVQLDRMLDKLNFAAEFKIVRNDCVADECLFHLERVGRRGDRLSVDLRSGAGRSRCQGLQLNR